MHYSVGALMIIVGIFLIYTVNKRRFNRRGLGGLQHYRTNEGSLFTRFIEMLAKWVGIILILLGIGAMALGYNMDQQGVDSIYKLRP